MEFVPLYFCESVCALLKSTAQLELLCCDNPNCHFWNCAIVTEFQARPTFILAVSYDRRNWQYHICGMPNVHEFQSFSQLKEACKEQSFRLEMIVRPPCLRRLSYSSNIEEMKEIVKFTSSYSHKTVFVLSNDFAFPPNFLDALHQNASFRKIGIYAMDSSFEELVRTQVKSAHLEELHLHGVFSDDLRLAVEDRFGPLSKLKLKNDTKLGNHYFKNFKKLVIKSLVAFLKCFFRVPFVGKRLMKFASAARKVRCLSVVLKPSGKERLRCAGMKCSFVN